VGELPPLNKMLQPGAVAFGLDIAGMWARATRRSLPDARLATNERTAPERWDYQSQGSSAVLTMYLAVEHTLPIVRNAPWLDTPSPRPLEELAELHARTGRFRDAFMHLDEKAARPQRARLTAAQAASPPGAPAGYIALGLYFDGDGAAIYATVERTEVAELTRVSWDEIDLASASIDAWALDLVGRWEQVEDRWNELVAVCNAAHGFG
jgi:hypothetical protein